MDSPTTPITANSCKFFENYGLDTTNYSAQYGILTDSWETPQEICIRKCRSIEEILKDNWTELIFTVKFPDLISQEKLMHTFSLPELTEILAGGDLLPEEREEIKRIRNKARNNKAAKNLRLKHKEQDKHLINDVTDLKQQKNDLIREMQEIREEINHYKSMGTLRK